MISYFVINQHVDFRKKNIEIEEHTEKAAANEQRYVVCLIC